MSEMEMVRARVLASLGRGVEQWVERGDEQLIRGWVQRELAVDGEIRRLGVGDWGQVLERLRDGRRRAKRWPEGCEEPIAAFVISVLRFTRPDGTIAMNFTGQPGSRNGESLRDWADWAKWYRGTAIARVLGWWIPRSKQDDDVSPPLPAWSSERGVLASLRADWRTDGDMLAVEHRAGGVPCTFELRGGGEAWLGPTWGVDDLESTRTRPKLTWWLTLSTADRVEWTERIGGLKVTRAAMLMRGRRMALLSTTIEGRGISSGEPSVGGRPAMHEAGFGLAPGVDVQAIENCRGLKASITGRKVNAQVLPIGLPCMPYATERGSILEEAGSIRLRHAAVGRRTFMPLLVSWDPKRNRKTVSWRVLTVTEKSKMVGPDRGFAVRLSWGRDETYVIYRSVGPPAPRTFLGYQTHARFMLGRFNAQGFVEPIVVDV